MSRHLLGVQSNIKWDDYVNSLGRNLHVAQATYVFLLPLHSGHN